MYLERLGSGCTNVTGILRFNRISYCNSTYLLANRKYQDGVLYRPTSGFIYVYLTHVLAILLNLFYYQSLKNLFKFRMSELLPNETVRNMNQAGYEFSLPNAFVETG